MKRFAIGLLATTVIAVALPAAAQSYGQGHDYRPGSGYNQGYGQGYGNSYQYGFGWSNGWERGGRANFNREFDHIYAGIQHGMNDGSYRRSEARQFFREVQNLRRLEAYYRANDGRVGGREAGDLRQRIARLHAIMHAAHQRGHNRQDYRGYDRGDYRGNDYRRNDRYDRDDRDDRDDGEPEHDHR